MPCDLSTYLPFHPRFNQEPGAGHLPGFPVRVVVEDDLELIGGARVVNQAGHKLLHLVRAFLDLERI